VRSFRWPSRTAAGGTSKPSTKETALITRTLAEGPVGPYQLQAAIAAVHAEAPCGEDTDWPQILGLYELLGGLAPGPMVTLNRIVAVAMVHGAAEGLRLLAAAEADDALTGHHRVNAVRAHLLEMVGDREAARDAYLLAARRTLSFPEQRYLEARAAALRPSPISG